MSHILDMGYQVDVDKSTEKSKAVNGSGLLGLLKNRKIIVFRL